MGGSVVGMRRETETGLIGDEQEREGKWKIETAVWMRKMGRGRKGGYGEGRHGRKEMA